MQQLLEVRNRMKTVAGIGEVCRTLSTVAAAKLAQTKERAVGARDYVAVLREMAVRQERAASQAGIDPTTLSPLMAVRPISRVLVLAVGADRGLCGGYNVSIGRTARGFIRSLERRDISVTLVTFGARIESYLARTAAVPIRHSESWTRAGVTDDVVTSLLERLTAPYIAADVDEVWALYTSFVSAITREPRAVRLLPIAHEQDPTGVSGPACWFYEPDQAACVHELLQSLVRLQVEDLLLESFASEQAARMVTMQEASERADRALVDLRVRYNRLRRESITADLTGVLVAGRMREAVRHAG